MTLRHCIICLLALSAFVTLRAEEQNPSNEEVAKIVAALPAKPAVKSGSSRHLLVFNRADGFVHKSIPVGTKSIQLLGEKTGAYSSEVSSDCADFSAENLKRFDGILFLSTTQLKMTDAQRAALLEFARSGKGIIGLHAATDNFYEWPEGSEMMGGLFCGHPWHWNNTVKIKLDEPEHPVNACFEGEAFHVTDEIYQFKEPYSRERQLVLLSLDMTDPETLAVKTLRPDDFVRTDDDFPVSWIKSEGKGRVFYSSLGHNKEIFWNTLILKHYLAGIQYALGDLDVAE
jgi:hypothetical protein